MSLAEVTGNLRAASIMIDGRTSGPKPEVRGRTRRTICANFGFGALAQITGHGASDTRQHDVGQSAVSETLALSLNL
jgi:hypothetical protein